MELDTLVVLLFDMTLKGAVLITMALLVTRLRLIHSPAWRSLVWTGMLTALLALPFASVLLPELRMPGLPALDQKISQGLRADANGPAMSVPGQAHVVMDEQNLIRITPSNILRVVPDTRAPSTTPPVGSVSLWILLFYTFGVCLVVRRIHESYRSMQHMQETILSDRRSRLNDRLSLWTARMGIKRPIAIGFSEAVTVPAQAGLKHPCILSPVTMFQASEEKLDAVIAHELAHVARQDLRWNFIVQVVRILYWFHPLVHLAYRRFLDAREEVCDEMAVAVLGNMRSYATTLLDVAAGLSRPSPIMAALGMVRTPHVLDRVERILTMDGRIPLSLTQRKSCSERRIKPQNVRISRGHSKSIIWACWPNGRIKQRKRKFLTFVRLPIIPKVPAPETRL